MVAFVVPAGAAAQNEDGGGVVVAPVDGAAPKSVPELERPLGVKGALVCELASEIVKAVTPLLEVNGEQNNSNNILKPTMVATRFILSLSPL